MQEGESQHQAGETRSGSTPQRPKVPMVRVINTHKFRSLFLRNGKKIGPGEQGVIPQAMFDKVGDAAPWLKRAERGDVI